MSETGHDRDRLPLAYTGALVGLVATASALIALTITFLITVANSLHPSFDRWQQVAISASFLLPLLSVPAVVVMIAMSAPIDAVIRKAGLAGPWPYVAATTCVVGLCYLFLFRLDSRAYGLALLIPAASLPCGLLLFYLARPVRRPEPVDISDALIVIAWIAAWLWYAIVFLHPPHSISSLDPVAGRHVIAGTASVLGLPIFMLCGILAGLARIWHLRLGAIIAGLAWLIPVSFIVAYYATPLGPDTFRFAVGKRQFDIDWHLSPRQTTSGFCIDASTRGTHMDFPRTALNQEVCVSQPGELLVSPPSDVPDPRIWTVAGLNCEQGANLRQACVAADDKGNITTLIVCHHRDCFHQFDNGGLRFSFHSNSESIATWRKMQEQTIRLIAEIGTRLT